MNTLELERILLQEGFNPRCFSLNEECKDEALCLRSLGHDWCVFYSERGLETGKVCFTNEAQACQDFLEKMRSDPTTKLGWKTGFGY